MPTTEWNQQAGMDGDANVDNVAGLASLATEAASNAEDSELAAAGSATAAAGSATLAGQHKTAAETAQGLAETAQGLSEGARDTALGYSNTASGHASNASISASNAAASYDSFDDRYLGAKASDPTLDNDGDALLTGALYFNSTSDEMKVYNGSSWDVVAGGGAGLGTVTSVGMTVPTGLSVSGSPITSSGSLAVAYTAGYAIPTTAKQTQWDTAYGWGDHASAGYLTGFTETNDLTAAVTWANVPNANITQASVTQHQSALSITESQISDLDAYLTTVALNDVSDVAITSPSSGQVLKYDGTNWVNGVDGGGGGGGIALTDLSVTTNPVGTAALSYNNVSGAFSYTPPDLTGYLTSYTETDTLDSVTDRNNTTTNTINVGGLSSTGSVTGSNLNTSNWDTAYGWGNHATAGYLTSYTETNNLTVAVTWANVPDAYITQSSVTQHQAALSITESQISDLGTYLSSGDTAASLTITSADINGGTVDGTNIGASAAGTGAFTTLNATGNTTITAELKADSYNESKGTVTSSAGSLTIDCHNGNVFSLGLTEDVTSTTFSNPPASGTAFGFSLFVTQGATARTITWPNAVAWPSGTAPTITTTSGKVDIFTFTTFDAGNTWYGVVSGQTL